MDITLVTSSYDNVVHGTENDRKTGCGINLLKPENVTRFHRTSRMTDLKEITCEKCKANLAKKLIKADKKEMALLLKEEKKREKMGLVDEGIVPLGNTTAKITRDPDAKRKEEEAKQRAAEEARRAAEESRRAAEEAAAQEAAQYESEPEVPINTIPGTGVPIDESLSEFAISIPTEEETTGNDDDFLAQFAIQKPDEVAASPSSQTASVVPEDDFLAQFAIPAPQSSPLPEDPAADMYYNEEPEEMDGLDVKPAPAYGQPAYGQPAQVQTEEDIMKMFSIDNTSVNEPAYSQPAYNQPAYEQPAYNQPAYEQPAYEQPAYEQPAYEQPAYNQPAYEQPAYNQPAYEQPAYNQPDMYAESTPAQEMFQSTEQDNAAEVMAYNNNYGVENYEETAPAYPQYDESQPMEMDELPIPSMDSNAAAPVSNIPSAAAYEELPPVEEKPAPVYNEAPAAQQFNEPKLNEIPSVPEVNKTAFNGVPAVPDITAPILNEIPTVPDITAPVNAIEPEVPDMPAPVLDDISTPILNMPSMAGQENNDMSDYNYVAPGVDTAQNIRNKEPEIPVQAQQPQIIKVPQFAGYDANNQPVYKYMQMKLVGVDQKGQPVYVPVQGQQPQAPVQPQRPVQPTAPAQQTAAQAQRAAAPVQQAPVKSVVPRRPVKQTGVPTANISKIAVNPHSKSTSQAFINAIASSKEYAGKNLIETQGLKANSPVLTSIEDVLSTMGDDSVKKQKIAQAQQAVPVFEEYKAPQASAPRRSAPSPMKAQQPEEKDVRYMTKAELKAKKKQDKIDAKFKKEMSKRGF